MASIRQSKGLKGYGEHLQVNWGLREVERWVGGTNDDDERRFGCVCGSFAFRFLSFPKSHLSLFCLHICPSRGRQMGRQYLNRGAATAHKVQLTDELPPPLSPHFFLEECAWHSSVDLIPSSHPPPLGALLSSLLILRIILSGWVVESLGRFTGSFPVCQVSFRLTALFLNFFLGRVVSYPRHTLFIYTPNGLL